jgi:hypothetical protein
MALESKPLFHPDVLRQQVRAFNLPERVGDWQPKLQHWTARLRGGACPPWTRRIATPSISRATGSS